MIQYSACAGKGLAIYAICTAIQYVCRKAMAAKERLRSRIRSNGVSRRDHRNAIPAHTNKVHVPHHVTQNMPAASRFS